MKGKRYIVGFFVKGIPKTTPKGEGKRISETFTVRSSAEKFAELARKENKYTHVWVADKMEHERAAA